MKKHYYPAEALRRRAIHSKPVERRICAAPRARADRRPAGAYVALGHRTVRRVLERRGKTICLGHRARTCEDRRSPELSHVDLNMYPR